MKNYTLNIVWATLSGALVCGLSTAEEIEETVVVASRIVESSDQVTEAIAVLDDLDHSFSQSLQDVIGNHISGVISTSTAGQRGQPGSLLLRGTTTNRSQLRVDGLRVSDSNILLGNFLGSTSVPGFGRVEILKGPQSALYGGEAIGGVVALETVAGEGAPSLTLFGEVGSFDSFLSGVEAQGSLESGLSYRLGYSYEETSNDLPNNDFDQRSNWLRLEQSLGERVELGLTFRSADARYETPQFGPQETDLDYQLGTLYLKGDWNEYWSSVVRFGFYLQDLEINSAFPFASEAEKYSLAFENEIRWTDWWTTSAGVIGETTDFSSSLGDSGERDVFGVYKQHILEVTDGLLLKGGVRWEDYDDFGDEFTWDLGARIDLSHGWAIKGNVGEAFRTPNFSELFGSDFTNPSPDLEAEKSIGWDVGIEKTFGADRNRRLSVTWFENEIENEIVTVFFGQAFNSPDDSKTSGLELDFTWEFDEPDIEVALAYTWLDQSLTDHPEQVVSLGLEWDVTDQLELGLQADWVDQRSFGGDALDDYLTVGLRAQWAINDQVTLYGRIDNLFDEDYLLFSSFGTEYSARGRGLFAGARVTF